MEKHKIPARKKFMKLNLRRDREIIVPCLHANEPCAGVRETRCGGCCAPCQRTGKYRGIAFRLLHIKRRSCSYSANFGLLFSYTSKGVALRRRFSDICSLLLLRCFPGFGSALACLREASILLPRKKGIIPVDGRPSYKNLSLSFWRVAHPLGVAHFRVPVSRCSVEV